MEYLYAPWRSNYIGSQADKQGCALCLPSEHQQDEKRYVIKRYQYTYIMLNLYPYNAGHVMVIPYTHLGRLSELDSHTREELIHGTALCEKIVQEVLHAEGFNIGCNIGGQAAGGTIPAHLHMHVLPRFSGDTNFLPLLSNTKQVSLDLNLLYQKLKKAFAST